MVDRWLASAHADGAALVFPGLPRDTTADLVIASRAITVTARGATADLAWERRAADVVDHEVPDDGPGHWALSSLYIDWSQMPIGLAICVDGGYVLSTDAVRSRTRPHPVWVRNLAPGHPIPLHDTSEKAPSLALVPVVHALLDVLGQRPELRARLDEPDRVFQLASDIRVTMGEPVDSIGARRADFEIEAALMNLGIRHRFGRPIAGEELPDREELRDRVRTRLVSSPYVERVPSAEQIDRVLQRRFYGIRPWPFAALTQPVRDGPHFAVPPDRPSRFAVPPDRPSPFAVPPDAPTRPGPVVPDDR